MRGLECYRHKCELYGTAKKNKKKKGGDYQADESGISFAESAN